MRSSMNIFSVKAVTISFRNTQNNNSRSIMIETDDGGQLEITCYGNTQAIDSLPRHEDFFDMQARGW